MDGHKSNMKNKLSKIFNRIIPPYDAQPISTDLSPEKEEQIINRLAEKIVQYRLDLPAEVALEAMMPITLLGSVGLVYLAPFLEVFGLSTYEYSALFRRRENVERLIRKIEERKKQL